MEVKEVMTFAEMRQLAMGKKRVVPRPKKKHGDHEHTLQCQMFKWFHYQYPALWHNIFAVPNGGERNIIVAKRLQQEGVKAGVSDIILLKPVGKCSGLLIEVKTLEGRQSEKQKDWQGKITNDGYIYIIIRTLEHFQKTIDDYLNERLTLENQLDYGAALEKECRLLLARLRHEKRSEDKSIAEKVFL